jgi:hypothetical protein
VFLQQPSSGTHPQGQRLEQPSSGTLKVKDWKDKKFIESSLARKTKGLK